MDISQCPQFQRIRLILNAFNSLDADLDKNEYSSTDLLNDFHYVKRVYNLDNDDEAFAKIYQLLRADLSPCDAAKSSFVARHYRSRLMDDSKKGDTEMNVPTDPSAEHTKELIAQIHVYFLHAYDINRLTPKETQLIEQQLDLLRSSGLDANEPQKDDDDGDRLAMKRVEMVAEVMRRKAGKLQLRRIDGKFTDEGITETVADAPDFEAMAALFDAHDDISVDLEQLKQAFAPFKDDKTALISHLIATYYGKEADAKAEAASIGLDHERKREIYEVILYAYIKPADLSTANFIEIAKVIVAKQATSSEAWKHIDVEEMAAIITQRRICGDIFREGHASYIKNMKMWRQKRFFSTMTNFKEKKLQGKFAIIWRTIKNWKPVRSKKEAQEQKEQQEQKVQMEQMEQDVKEQEQQQAMDNDVYDLGTRFYYWERMKAHKHYVPAWHASFKEEVLHNQLFEFSIGDWDLLTKKCDGLSECDYARHIQSNGQYQYMYGINEYEPLTSRHLLPLKLYTDYTDLCDAICGTLRSNDKAKIQHLANWARLLSECVQVFGSSLKSAGIQRYFRGVGKVFSFSMFIMRLNLPTSTTTEISKAFQFSGEGGLVVEFQGYGDMQGVFKFECEVFSRYDEKETLFFGGDTILSIVNIRQCLDAGWASYKIFIHAMDAIVRLIKGRSLKDHPICSKRKQKITMLGLFRYMLQASPLLFEDDIQRFELPLYIAQLFTLQVSNDVIRLHFGDFVEVLTWLRPMFMKGDMINLVNVCVLFGGAERVSLMMPSDYVLSDAQWDSLLSDFRELSTMNMATQITLEWPAAMPETNKQRFTVGESDVTQCQWTCSVTPKRAKFTPTSDQSFTVQAQYKFKETLDAMLSLPMTVARAKSTKPKKKTAPVSAVVRATPTTSKHSSIAQNTVASPAADVTDDNDDDRGYIHTFSALIAILESTATIKAIKEHTLPFSRLIADFAIIAAPIAINYKSMVLNISKEGWSDAEGHYGLKNLFGPSDRCYCSADDSGNCVDLLLDLQKEYTLRTFHAWTTGRSYTCPLKKAYLWVFGTKTAVSLEHIQTLCRKQLYAKVKFDRLKSDYDVIDPKTNERKRDEMLPVAVVEGEERYHWKLQTPIASHIKGRYVLIKLIASGNSNVDAKYVGIDGYQM